MLPLFRKDLERCVAATKKSAAASTKKDIKAYFTGFMIAAKGFLADHDEGVIELKMEQLRADLTAIEEEMRIRKDKGLEFFEIAFVLGGKSFIETLMDDCHDALDDPTWE